MAEITFGTLTGVRSPATEPASGDGPLRMLVVGDFSGRCRTASDVAGAKPVLVDRDNLDDAIARHAIQLDNLVAGEGVSPISAAIGSMNDFHPDALYERLEIFTTLRHLRRRLTNPNTFADAAAEVRCWGQTISPTGATASPHASAPPHASVPSNDAPEQRPEYSTEGLFDLTLGATDQRPAADEATSWRDLIRDIAAPYALPNTKAEVAELTAVVDRATGATMRAILRHERFRRVELAWRGVEFLTRRLETDTSLKLFVLDAPLSAIADDVATAGDLSKSAFYRRLVEETVNTPGGKPWGAILLVDRFDATSHEADVLGRLAKIAQAAGAPIIAGAHDHLAGCESLCAERDPDDWTWTPDAASAAAWRDLRKLPEAAYIGLALPRLLMRLPYGSRSNPTEKFAFEELPDDLTDTAARHERLAWGSAAIACGYLLGAAYTASGWRMRPGDVLDIDELPLFVDRIEDEAVAIPCGEALLVDRAAEQLIAVGLMPLVSYRDTDRVRVAGFRSIRGPQERLAGRWAN
jgi:type VI secretion system protein ImpC